MAVNIQSLTIGQVVWSGDSYGYDIVKVTKELHTNEDFPFPVVEVEDVLTGRKDLLGGIGGYEPNFYPIRPQDLFGEKYKEFAKGYFTGEDLKKFLEEAG